MMRGGLLRFGIMLAAVVCCWGGPVAAATRTSSAQAIPLVGARAAILIDARTGTILYEKNAFRQMDPASLTKMMTALLVIEHGHLNRLVKISKRADYTPGSSLHIMQNQQYTRLDLLKGLLLRSGNDASVALAESEAGSVERFVAEMNVEAQRVGAFNTSFENPNGLTKPGHYSSAYDLALIARQALRQPLFQEIVKSPELTITEQKQHRLRVIHNTNQLLYGFPGADGVKTGTTDAAGKCLVASATRDHRQLIAVVLNSPNRWGDASRLLNWGFRYWRIEQAVQAGQSVATVRVVGGQAEHVTLAPRHSVVVDVPTDGTFKRVVSVPEGVLAPLSQHRRVGFLTILAPNQPSLATGLYPTRSIPAKPRSWRFWESLWGRR